MKPRYYVQQGLNNWLVLDRDKIRMHNDVVMTLHTRREARGIAQKMNSEHRPQATEEVRHDTRPD
jgi:hypothetical protein